MNAVANLKELVSEKNLKLSILDPDSAQQGGLLTVNRGGTNVAYGVSVEPCSQPTCPCCEVRFQCRVDAEGHEVSVPSVLQEFWLDTRAKEVVLTPELEREPDSLSLARDVAAALTADDWQRLYQWLRATKLEIIENARADDVDITRLPDASRGRMVPFIEVFPFGLAFYFEEQGAIWAADDMYCVRHDCGCKETLLSFFMVQDAAGVKTTSVSDPPGIRYNYRTESARLAFSGTAEIEPMSLLAVLKRAYPGLNLMLERRHLLMQTIYLRRHAERLSSRLQRLAPLARRKVGRNDPCPCGSGKKFKRCCLGKTQKVQPLATQ